MPRLSFKKWVLVFCLLFSGCRLQEEKPLSGYIEGEYTYISTGISGTLLRWNVTRGQSVKKGEWLFSLDPQPEQAAMEVAKANIEQLQAELNFAKVQLARHEDLYEHHATDKSTLDLKKTDFESQKKQLLAAQQTLMETAWAFQQKTVYAPVTGYVFDTFYRIGEKTIANYPVLAILAPEDIHVLFYIPEKKLSSIHLGQRITFDCDGCTRTAATIHYISPEAEYTPPIIYSQDTRYKLVYLVRADMPKTKALAFHPGQPLDIFLHES